MYSNSAMAMKEPVDGLPKQFVSSLRILFDILDETRSGFIRLRDIESRWSDDGVRGLPPGVIDGLRRVTPPNGLLSFDRFVAGLKLVLIKKQDDTERRPPFMSKENRSPPQEYMRDLKSNKFINDARSAGKSLQNIGSINYDNFHQQEKRADHRHHSDSYYDVQHPQVNHRKSPTQASKSGPILRDRPHSAYVIKPEVSSYPNTVGSYHPPPNSAGIFNQGMNSNQIAPPHDRDKAPALPPRPVRSQRTISNSTQMKKSVSGPNLASESQSPPVVPPRGQYQSTLVLSDLKHWQREWTANHTFDRKHGHDKKLQPPSRNSNKDNEIYANIEQFQRRSEGEIKQPPHKASVQRHGSGRRHTLANGIDQNMVKRLKQLDEETSMLHSGLAMVESAKDWYTRQLALVSDKQAMLGKVTYNDNSVEAYQERMNFQKARIAEINQHLQTLLESSEKGFPIHMNLAMSSANKPTDNVPLQGLREQNRRLLEEVSQKKEQISQLEKEKATLVRDLFEVRSKNKSSLDDTTFM